VRSGSEDVDEGSTVKIVLVGDEKSGKSAFVRSFSLGDDFVLDEMVVVLHLLLSCCLKYEKR
jgi:hypothetical protein